MRNLVEMAKDLHGTHNLIIIYSITAASSFLARLLLTFRDRFYDDHIETACLHVISYYYHIQRVYGFRYNIVYFGLMRRIREIQKVGHAEQLIVLKKGCVFIFRRNKR